MGRSPASRLIKPPFSSSGCSIAFALLAVQPVMGKALHFCVFAAQQLLLFRCGVSEQPYNN
jgi:hypothetical protein